MPRKKDPRMRNIQAQNTTDKVFDSADYEVQRQKTTNDTSAREHLRDAASKAPHVTQA